MRLFRYIIVVLLFCAVIWGFWMNNQRRMAMLGKPPLAASVDRTGSVLTAEQERQLTDFQKQFQDAYGIALRIGVTADPAFTALRAAGPGAVVLGIAPDSGAVLFEAPPLARAAIGDPLIRYIRYVHFVPYFATRTWPEGLESALNMLTRRLDAAVGPGGDGTR